MTARIDELPGITYRGSHQTKELVMGQLPDSLRDALGVVNGLVAFRGGLHIRGAVDEPAWHSLGAAWRGHRAFWRHYRSLTEADVPFGQDALGDQFFLRGEEVWRLLAETDEAEVVSVSLADFLGSCLHDPVGFLSLEPLLRLEQEGSHLSPGQLINAYPPFATSQSSAGNVSLRAVPIDEQHYFLEKLSATLRDLPPGAPFEMKFVD